MAKKVRAFLFVCGIVSGLALAVVIVTLAGKASFKALAAPIDPPEGYPKFNQSSMAVSPDLVPTTGATLVYTIEVINTGAFTATNVSVEDVIPANTTYNNDATASAAPAPVFANGALTWNGTVGFDSRVLIQFSVEVDGGYEGIVTNQASIEHASLDTPVLVTAEALVSDDPFFEITKSASPSVPGPDKPLTYTLSITNLGQDATALPVTVSDVLPANTSYLRAGPKGTYDSANQTVTWIDQVNLARGDSTHFTYTVQIDDVLSGTVIANEHYQVANDLSGVVSGESYTVTVLDPILFIYKETDPFPPGSNQEITYTLTVLNKGSEATNLEIQDTLPAGVTYVRGGEKKGNTVSWTLASLDTGETAEFSFTVLIGDIAEVPILNSDYQVCSAEGICQSGLPLTSIIKGPSFAASAALDPIAKKPGGGGGPVTPTLTITNMGPGNALDASALIYFRRISVSMNDLAVIPGSGTVSDGPECGDKCVSYQWSGDIAAGGVVTFTTIEGQSTIGGEEGTNITATIIVSDLLGTFAYEPITATAVGTITHFANLIPRKSAPAVIGAGQVMTYSFSVFNSGLSTDTPPFPTLTDSVPPSLTLLSVSDGGVSFDLDGQTVVSWTLPSMSPGDLLSRSYSVLVDPDLVSGSLIVNDNYHTSWFDVGADITETYTLSNTGKPVTTLVQEVGLVDSSKTVTPTWSLPGPANVLTYVVHIANSSLVPLSGVQVHDELPWQVSTYQRDALASAGDVISDIVSLDWNGSVGPLSEELITFTVLVDPGYEGPVTNTAVITHTSLSAPVRVQAVAYITDDPVLRITKSATPDPVPFGEELLYTIRVANLGQDATELVVADSLPADTSFVPYSASGNGQLAGDQVKWSFPILPAGETRELSFRVKVNAFHDLVNAEYWVSCHEGVSAYGEPLVTRVKLGLQYLPLILNSFFQ
jgi:uncharacterized repeat protein (TIGR01451 family)